jgi:hypothetical protein
MALSHIYGHNKERKRVQSSSMNRKIRAEETYNHQIADATASAINNNIIVERATRPMTTEGNGRGGRNNKESRKRIMSSGASGRISSNINPMMSGNQVSQNQLQLVPSPPAGLSKENSKRKLEHEHK